jgi:sec-independent protein translocase protein TatA
MLGLTMSVLGSFMNLGGPDLIWILLLVLLLFGAKKLPELARGLGQAIKEFQKAKDEFTDELHKAGQNEVKPTASTQSVPQNPPAPASTQTRPDPAQSIPPGDQANKV